MKKTKIILTTLALALLLLSCGRGLECAAYYEVSPNHPKYITDK